MAPQSDTAPGTILETPRLVLREFTHGDDAFLLRLLNEPSWLRFIGDRGVRTLGDARRYVDDGPRASQARNGFALWCVVPKETGMAAGMCGLVRRDTLPGPDVGFAFLPDVWVAQSLFGIVYSLDACITMLPHKADDVRNELIGLRSLANSAHDEVRRSIFDLWPSALTIERFHGRFDKLCQQLLPSAFVQHHFQPSR